MSHQHRNAHAHARSGSRVPRAYYGHPHHAHRDPYYGDPTYYSGSGCGTSVFYIFLFLVFIAILFVPLIVCWTGNCNGDGSDAKLELPASTVVIHGGAGGHPMQGLTLSLDARTHARSHSRSRASASACGPGEEYNASKYALTCSLLDPLGAFKRADARFPAHATANQSCAFRAPWSTNY
jgi:hypothetical protein